MHSEHFFIQALIYLTAAVLSVPLAKRMGLGSVLGYLLAGILIGPFVLNIVGKEGTDIMHFAEFGVVMMLFLIGLELKPSLLWKMKNSIFGLGGLQVLITSLIISLVALSFKMEWPQAITIGLIFSLSSTAIVIQSLSEKNLLNNNAGRKSFSVLLFQDIAVIPVLAVLPLLANYVKQGISSQYSMEESNELQQLISQLPGWQQLLLIISAVAVIIIGGRYFSRYVFRFIASSGLREIFTATALLIVVGIALLMSSLGLSPALGTFLAGVVLADNEYRHELETNIEPFKGLLLGLFFIAVGASINFKILVDNVMVVFILLGLLILIKFGVLYLLARRFKLHSGEEMLFALSLSQAGEFGFVLISFSTQNSLLSTGVSNILLIVITLSMLVTPLLLIINDKLVQPMYFKSENENVSDEIDEKDNPVIIAGSGRFGLVIGRFLKANGIKATILDNNPDNITMLRKFGFKVYYGDASRTDLLITAGIKQAKLFILAIDNNEKTLEIIDYLQKYHPHLKIIARARDIREVYQLLKRNIFDYRREIYDSALEIGKKALSSLGFSKFQTQRAANIFKYHDDQVVKELFVVLKEDKKRYIKEAKRFTESLEKRLMEEQEYSIHESDNAWDVTTLREEVKSIYSDINKKEEDN